MLANRRAYPTIPAADLERAKAWYGDKLGLKPTREDFAGLIYELADNTGFLLYATDYAGKAPNTLMSFSSEDVEGDVAKLKARGVAFEELDQGELKTVDSVATIGDLKAAWFRDSEGNILAIGNERL